MTDKYFPDDRYAEEMREHVLPYITSRRTDDTFIGADGKPLHYAYFKAEGARASVTIVHGFTESCEKYHEMTYYFLKSGLSVFIPEHRGHGTSHREVEDLTLTHVNRFTDYVDDLAVFMKTVVCEKEEGLRFAFAHSMGGAVTALYLERPDCLFDKAVLSSPMIAPTTGGFPKWATKLLCRAAILFGKGKKRVFVSQPYPGHEKFEESAAGYKPRFEEYQAYKTTRKELQNYSPTYRWMLESVNATKKILKRGEPEKIQIPVLLFSVKQDTFVQIPPQREFISRVKDGELVTLNCKHEIFASSEETLHPYLDRIFGFFA